MTKTKLKISKVKAENAKAKKSNNRPAHRPKIYTDSMLDELAENLFLWIEENIKSQKKKFLLGEWCFSVGFSNRNFARYSEQNENFRRAYEYAKQWQEFQVTKGALYNELNARFAQFFLAVNHNWTFREQQDTRESKAKSALQCVSDQLKAISLKTGNLIGEIEFQPDHNDD